MSARTVSALCLLGTSALLAACGGVSAPSGGGDGGGGGGEQPESITTMGFGLPDEIASVRVETYEEESGVDVEVVEGGFDEQQFLSAVAGGDPPDVVYLDRNIIGTYAARGAIQPMDDCVEQADVDMDAYRDAAVDQVTVDGVVYGLPEFFSVRVVIADDAALDSAGLAAEDVAVSDPSALLQAETAMTVRSGSKLSRIGYDPKLPEFLPLWAAANDVELISEDGRTANLDDPAVVEAVDGAAALVRAAGGWEAFKAFRESWDFFGEQNQFTADQLGAMPMEDWYVNQLAEVSGDQPAGVTVTPFLDRDGEPVTYASGQAWAVPKGASDPEAACEFAATMTRADTWVAAATARAEALRDGGGRYTGTFTGNEVADEQIFADVYEPVDDPALESAVQTIRDVQDSAVSLPASPAAAEFQKAYEAGVLKVLQGEMPAAEAMAEAQEVAQTALDEASGG